MKVIVTVLIALAGLAGCWRYNAPYPAASPFEPSRQTCESDGGTWDFRTATCVMPR